MNPPKKKIKLSNEDGPNQFDFSQLPYNVLLDIFKCLDFKTVARCATLCRRFRDISNESVIYSRVVFKYSMGKPQLESYISRATCPRHLSVEYKFFNDEESWESDEDYADFDSCVVRFIKRSGTSLTSIHFESCRNNEVLSLVMECPNLIAVKFLRCKSTFDSLPTLRNLIRIELRSSTISKAVLQETLQNNSGLKALTLLDNSNLNTSDICESLAKYNQLIGEVHIGEKKRVRSKGLKSLARCPQLRSLELVGSPFQCDPEDSLQHLAAGCPLLERLTLYGWKDVNDENLMPILHSCTQLKHLDLRGIGITIKSCREAALSLPFLKTLDVYKCSRIKKAQIAKLQREFDEIKITS